MQMITSARWRRLRNEVIKERPLCEECARRKVYRPAQEVHHIKPVVEASLASREQKERLMFDKQNLMSLCHDCHAAIHRAMGNHTGKAKRERASEATKGMIERLL